MREYTYVEIDGTYRTVGELEWLEDSLDSEGNECARYSISSEESVWLASRSVCMAIDPCYTEQDAIGDDSWVIYKEAEM